MSTFDDLIRKSGKGYQDAALVRYSLEINFGGTIGTWCYSSEGWYNENTKARYRGKLISVSGYDRSISPDTGGYQVSDITCTLENASGEFARYPWNKSVLNKPAIIKIEVGSDVKVRNLADGTYGASGEMIADGGLMWAQSTLFEGDVKKLEYGGRSVKLSLGDSTYKINRRIPPRRVTLAEFPNAGTSVMLFGTSTNAETDIIGKPIPYIYGDYTYSPFIKPLFIDTVKKRYLIADHPIGTVARVFSSGIIQQSDFTVTTSGTHTGTKLMSFIDFGTSQGTKTVLLEVTGKIDSGGTKIDNPAIMLKDLLMDANIGALPISRIGTADFDESESYFSLSGMKVRCVMDGEKYDNLFSFIEGLCYETMSDFFFNSENKAIYRVFKPQLNPDSTYTADLTTIIKDSLSASIDVRDLVNDVIVNYNYNPHEETHWGAYQVSGTASITDYSNKPLQLDSQFLYVDTDARDWAKRMTERYGDSIYKVGFTSPVSILPLEIDDIIELTSDELPADSGASGGWDNRLLQVIGINVDGESKEVSLDCWDANMLNSRYLFLGDTTKQGTYYDTATDSDKRYGYLCGVNGTFYDGSEGYRLW